MEKAGNWKKHLGAEERAMIMLMKLDGSGVRETARFASRISTDQALRLPRQSLPRRQTGPMPAFTHRTCTHRQTPRCVARLPRPLRATHGQIAA